MDANFTDISVEDGVIRCEGAWTIGALDTVLEKVQRITSSKGLSPDSLDLSHVTALDTAGALALHQLIQSLAAEDTKFKVSGMSKDQQQLFAVVDKQLPKLQQPAEPEVHHNWLYCVGMWSTHKFAEYSDWIAFVGRIGSALLARMFKPSLAQIQGTVLTMDENGYQAMPIVALMVFMIGVVLGYELSNELKLYGADVYVVDITGVAILREFGPLITAIVMAARTSTTFAAMIGTMKVNEELDVMRTMGVEPVDRLVLPRILGLMLALPLLTVWADVFGVIGSMIMAKSMLGISFYAFLDRFQHAVGLKEYVLGMLKTPVFATIIVVVGCYQGFSTSLNSDSVGRQTTRAAVQAIFLLIVADAGFAVIFGIFNL